MAGYRRFLRRAVTAARRLAGLARPPATGRVTRVVTSWDGVTVTGRLSGVRGTAGTTVVMSSGEARVELPVSVDGDRFAFAVPVERIEPAPTAWRFSFVSPPVPVGRFRDERSVRYPALVVPVVPGKRVRLQAHYSARGRLLLTCSHPETPQ